MRPAQLVVLMIALGAAGLAVVLFGQSDPPPPPVVAAPKPLPTVEVLVAKTEIATGQTVAADNLGWQVWPLEAAAAGFLRKGDRPDAVKEFTGAIARSGFLAGEPIREAKLIKKDGSGFLAAMLPAGKRAVSIDISPETGAGGFILPNDRVDVILTRREAGAADKRGSDAPTTETILSNIRVLAIDQAIEEKNGQRVVIGKTATLELDADGAERLVLSRQLGTMSLALRSIADAAEAARPKTPPETFNVVRYGITTSAAKAPQ